MAVLVRIAPSPTGFLHVGNIRTALFNWLFARQQGGGFMLRLDDTDQSRSTPAFAAAIETDLTWLGMNWDSFAKQSDRYARYADMLEQLKAAGRVYACFETADELALKRKSQLARGLPPIYDRAALKLSADEVALRLARGEKPHWRFRLLDEPVVWDDLVQGRKEFAGGALSDPVLVREDGVPLYTYCSVVDDVDFGVTHVIRGEDHVANTAVQIQIWQAVAALAGKPGLPVFGHLPLLTLASGEELSKRLGSMSVGSLRDEFGVEPLAVQSLLARIGTSDAIEPAGSLQELIAALDFKKVGRAPPKFDTDELLRLNAKILHHMDFATAQPRLRAMGLARADENFWLAVRGNLQRFRDVAEWWAMTREPLTFAVEDFAFTREAATLLPPAPWDAETWSVWTRRVKEATGRSGKALFLPLRLALTGRADGPELKALLPLIGPERAQARLRGEAA